MKRITHCGLAALATGAVLAVSAAAAIAQGYGPGFVGADCINRGLTFPGFRDMYFTSLFSPPGFANGAAYPRGTRAPEELVRLSSEEELERYLAGQRRLAELYREKLAEARQTRDAATEAKKQADAKAAAARAAAEGHRSARGWSDERLEEEARDRAKDAAVAAGVEKVAQANLHALENGLAQTEERIEEATASGAPSAPDALLSQFRNDPADRNSLYRAHKSRNEGFHFVTDEKHKRWVDYVDYLRGDMGSQFLRSAPGHAKWYNAVEGHVGIFSMGQMPGFINGHMQDGVIRNLRDAVARGDVAGIIEKVPVPGVPGETQDKVTVLPEGLDAAKPFLDVLDSLTADLAYENEVNRALKEESERAWDVAARQEGRMIPASASTTADRAYHTQAGNVDAAVAGMRHLVATR